MPSENLQDQSNQAMQGLGNLVERVGPWLFEVGSWIFGGLIAFNLVVIASLITVGPVDVAILISVAAFASALPLNVAGICLLRLIKDVKDVGIEAAALQAFQDAGFPNIEAYFPSGPAGERVDKRRSTVALGYSLGMIVLSVALTVTGLVAAMWHMARWVAVVLCGMIVISAVLLAIGIGHALPPESPAEVELKRRYREGRARMRTDHEGVKGGRRSNE